MAISAVPRACQQGARIPRGCCCGIRYGADQPDERHPARSRRTSQLAGGAGGSPAGPMKAKTWLVPGSRRRPLAAPGLGDGCSSRPSAADGGGKWFADPPKGIETTCWPLAGLRPCTALSAPMVQTSPSAMIGPPAAPSLSVHSCFRYGALAETLIAVTPFGQGTKTIEPIIACPPLGSPWHTGSDATSPSSPPRCP